MASLRPLLVGAVLLAACGGDGTGSADPGSAPVDECDGPAGSWTDLSSEPEWFRDDSSNRINWTDEGGCAVNLEFVFHRFGDDHCEWDAAEFISIGVPIGTPYTGENAVPPEQDWEPQFFHNTDQAVSHFDAGSVLGELPANAVDTGLRAAGDRAMYSSPDETELYLLKGSDVFVFVPVADEDVACA